MAFNAPARLKIWYRKIQPWLIWSLGSLFYLSEYFARVDPSIIVPELMSAFHLDAFALGGLSATFYIPYILMQLPAGALIDRYGPHRVLTLASFLCALSCLFFAIAQHLWVAELSRIMMGATAAFAFVGVMKLVAIWFDTGRMGMLAGLVQGVGMFGAALGEGGVSMVVRALGWRATLVAIALVLLVITVLIGACVRDNKPSLLGGRIPNVNQLSMFERLMIVFRNTYSWRNAAYAGFLYAPMGVFAEFWGSTFLHQVYHLPKPTSAMMVSLTFIGLAIGGPLFGWWSDRIQRRRPLMLGSSIGSLALMSVLVVMPALPFWVLCALLFLYGITNAGIALSYAYASEINPQPVAGVSVAFTNMASVAIAASLQPAVGWLLDLYWQGGLEYGAPMYGVHNYRHAMILLPIALVVSLAAACSLKETHCKGR